MRPAMHTAAREKMSVKYINRFTIKQILFKRQIVARNSDWFDFLQLHQCILAIRAAPSILHGFR